VHAVPDGSRLIVALAAMEEGDSQTRPLCSFLAATQPGLRLLDAVELPGPWAESALSAVSEDEIYVTSCGPLGRTASVRVFGGRLDIRAAVDPANRFVVLRGRCVPDPGLAVVRAQMARQKSRFRLNERREWGTPSPQGEGVPQAPHASSTPTLGFGHAAGPTLEQGNERL